MNQYCFNVEIWLKMKVEPKYVYWRCFNVETKLKKLRWFNVDDPLFQRWYLVRDESWVNVETTLLYCCADVHKKVAENETSLSKFSSIKHIFLSYKNIVKLLFHL